MGYRLLMNTYKAIQISNKSEVPIVEETNFSKSPLSSDTRYLNSTYTDGLSFF